MSLLIKIAAIINLITLISFSAGFILILKKDVNPKLKADLGVFTGILTAMYLISLCLMFVYYCINIDYKAITVIIFLLLPFLIGKLVKYETLKIYSTLQIFCFAMSTMFLFCV